MNAVVPPQDLSSSNPYGGKVTASTLPMYQDHSASSTQITTLKINTSVNILDYYRDSSAKQSWYKVSASGKSGWVRAGDVAFNSTSGLTHDLNYVDAYTFGSNLLDWHVAGGNCYIGLYYRQKLRYSPTATTPRHRPLTATIKRIHTVTKSRAVCKAKLLFIILKLSCAF